MTVGGNTPYGPGSPLPPPSEQTSGVFLPPINQEGVDTLSDVGLADAEYIAEGSRKGSIRVQDAATATPRPPTVAEARQRDKARKEREAAEEFAAAQELARQRRASQRRKMLMGSVAIVGVAGVIGLSYLGADRDREVSATCVKDGTDEVVPDEYCSSGTSRGGGIFIWAGSPYRYYYGGSSGGVGTIARGGTLELPKDTVGRTKAGSTITRKGSGVSITRGGFGSNSHSSGT